MWQKSNFISLHLIYILWNSSESSLQPNFQFHHLWWHLKQEIADAGQGHLGMTKLWWYYKIHFCFLTTSSRALGAVCPMRSQSCSASSGRVHRQLAPGEASWCGWLHWSIEWWMCQCHLRNVKRIDKVWNKFLLAVKSGFVRSPRV